MIKIPAYFTRFGSRSDGSASLAFVSQEMSSKEFAELKDHLNDFGYLLFSPKEITIADIPREELTEDDEKKPSRRLRASLYVFWTQQGKQGNFEDFYRKNMETFIEVVKNKLE